MGWSDWTHNPIGPTIQSDDPISAFFLYGGSHNAWTYTIQSDPTLILSSVRSDPWCDRTLGAIGPSVRSTKYCSKIACFVKQNDFDSIPKTNLLLYNNFWVNQSDQTKYCSTHTEPIDGATSLPNKIACFVKQNNFKCNSKNELSIVV